MFKIIKENYTLNSSDKDLKNNMCICRLFELVKKNN